MIHHVYLSPGMFGFTRVASYDYFSPHVSDVPPTASVSRVLLLTLVVACGPSLESATRHAKQANERSIAALEQARAAAGTAFQPVLVSFDPTTRVAAGPRSHGLAEQERLYATPSGVAFLVQAPNPAAVAGVRRAPRRTERHHAPLISLTARRM